MQYCTVEGRDFVKAHGKQGSGGWVCKETDAPINQITVQQSTGTPAFEPGDRGTYLVSVAHLWCTKCTDAKDIPDAKKLEGTRVAEASLVQLY